VAKGPLFGRIFVLKDASLDFKFAVSVVQSREAVASQRLFIHQMHACPFEGGYPLLGGSINRGSTVYILHNLGGGDWISHI